MGTGRLLRACVVMLAFLAAAVSARPALAQANFDRPGGDYLSAPVTSGDPADCALVCERDRRCRAWTFSYPTDLANRAVCWLKSNVPARVQSDCCVSGVRGAGVVEPRNDADRNLDRPLRRRLQEFRSQERRRRRRLQGRLRRRQQMPRLDLCPAGLCRQGSALLPEERHQAAAAEGGVYLGRGAVAALRPPSLRAESERKRNPIIAPSTASTGLRCAALRMRYGTRIRRQHRDLRPQRLPSRRLRP